MGDTSVVFYIFVSSKIFYDRDKQLNSILYKAV